MLNCIYHISGKMEVVDNACKEKMLASGEWFDHPNKAKDYREKKDEKELRNKSKHSKSKTREKE